MYRKSIIAVLTTVAIVVSFYLTVSAMNLKNSDDLTSEIRTELETVLAQKNDEEFAFALSTVVEKYFRFTTLIKHGDWFPIANSARFAIAQDGAVVLKSSNDEQTEVEKAGVWLVDNDGNWCPQVEGAPLASVNITENYVFVFYFEKETYAMVKR